MSYRREPDPILILTAEGRHTLPRSSHSSPIQTSSGKQPQTLNLDQISEQPFLSIIFNREDCLQSASDDEKRDASGGNIDGKLDPRLLDRSSAVETENFPMTSPNYLSGIPSPQRSEATRSMSGTHFGGRQSIVNAINVHPNLELNMPFSSGVFPTWAMMIINTRPNPGSLKPAFARVHQEAMVLLENGAPIESIIEIHPNIAALFDENAYSQSGLLSRWSASVVHSLQLSGKSRLGRTKLDMFKYLVVVAKY